MNVGGITHEADHAETVVKLLMVLALFYGIYHHHTATIKFHSTGYDGAVDLSP